MFPNILLAINVIVALFSCGVMIYAAIHERHGRALYILVAVVFLYYAGAYAYILISGVTVTISSALLIRTPFSLLLIAPAILYIMRDTTWTPPSLPR